MEVIKLGGGRRKVCFTWDLMRDGDIWYEALQRVEQMTSPPVSAAVTEIRKIYKFAVHMIILGAFENFRTAQIQALLLYTAQF
jgi:hypothetical protein